MSPRLLGQVTRGKTAPNRLRRFNSRLRVLGVAIDPDRVRDAEPFAEPGLEFRRGGFSLPLAGNETVSVVCAFNVLRQYAESEVAADPRQIFARAALRLADHFGYQLDRRSALLRRAFLVLGPEWPLS